MKNNKSLSTLPEDYIAVYDLNLKDKKAFIWLNLLSVFIVIPFIIGFSIYASTYNVTTTFDLTELLIMILAMFLMIVIHELIHGIFFKLGTKEKVSYKFHGWAASASVKGIYFYKKHYLLTGLAPFIILTPIFILLMFILPTYAFGVYFILALHTSACCGDFYVTYKLLKYPEDTLVHDYGIGMTFFTRKK